MAGPAACGPLFVALLLVYGTAAARCGRIWPMRWHFGGHVHGGGISNARLVSIIAVMMSFVSASVDSSALQGGFSISGNVSLPDGNPAIRVIVKISGLSGLNREVRTDNQGRYEFQTIPGGRYRL